MILVPIVKNYFVGSSVGCSQFITYNIVYNQRLTILKNRRFFLVRPNVGNGIIIIRYIITPLRIRMVALKPLSR